MIRRATQNDFDFIYKLYMHPQVNSYLLYKPMDAAAFKPIFDDLLAKGIKYIFEQKGKSIGMCKLLSIYLSGIAYRLSWRAGNRSPLFR
jgi:hypothetical protein